MSYRFVTILLLASMTANVAHAGEPYNFVKEYIRELAALEAIRDNAADENARSASNTSAVIAECIHGSQLFELELNTDISLLKQVKLEKPVDFLPSELIELDQKKLEQYRRMTEICSAMAAGPKPGVDYGQFVAEMPKITANIEWLDQTMFQASPAVFAALIDQRPDKENHLNHLVITKAEGDALVHELDLSFGKKMDQDNKNWGVGAASVLKNYLTKKGYKFADEPW